jgi:hypothetical protein
MKISKQQLIQIIKEEIEFSQHHEKSSDQVFSDKYDESSGLAKELRLKSLYNILSEIKNSSDLSDEQKKKIDFVINRISSIAQMVKDKSLIWDQT